MGNWYPTQDMYGLLEPVFPPSAIIAVDFEYTASAPTEKEEEKHSARMRAGLYQRVAHLKFCLILDQLSPQLVIGSQALVRFLGRLVTCLCCMLQLKLLLNG